MVKSRVQPGLTGTVHGILRFSHEQFHSVSQNNFAAVQFALPTQENFGMFDIKDTIMKLYGKDIFDLKMEAASSYQAAASYLRAIGCIILATIRNYRLVFSGLLVVILYLILVVYDTKIDIGPIQAGMKEHDCSCSFMFAVFYLVFREKSVFVIVRVR